MDTTTAKNLALDLMSEHGLTALGWTFTFDRAKKRAGVCRYRVKQIGMSESYVRLNGEAEVRDTILHEIAHAHAGAAAGHGHAWRAMARSIGADPSRCTTAQITEEKGRYEARCPGHGAPHVAAHYFRRPGRGMLLGGKCTVHNQAIEWFDTVAGEPLLPVRDMAAALGLTHMKNLDTGEVTRLAPVAAKKPEAPWVSGSSDWDMMFDS